jgi:hypothetical protein
MYFPCLNGCFFSSFSGTAIAQVVFMAVLLFGLLAAVGDRLKEKDIISMLFLLANLLGHSCILASVAASLTAEVFVLGFAVASVLFFF